MRKMGKKLLAVLFAVALLLCAVPVGSIAVSAEQSGDYEYEIFDDGSASILQYMGEGGDIVIPDEIDGHKVIEIFDNSFSWCDSLTSVVIPDGVVNIGYCAFANCTS